MMAGNGERSDAGAVDWEDYACHEGATLRAYEVEESTDEVFWLAVFAHRSRGDDLFVSFGRGTVRVELHMAVLGCDEEAGCDSIYADAALCEVDGTPLCEVCDAGFCAAIARDSRQRVIGAHR